MNWTPRIKSRNEKQNLRGRHDLISPGFHTVGLLTRSMKKQYYSQTYTQGNTLLSHPLTEKTSPHKRRLNSSACY